MKVSETLAAMAREVRSMEVELNSIEEKDHETVYRYHYGKGALDYRDKLLKILGDLPQDCTAATSYEFLRNTFPDPYPGN